MSKEEPKKEERNLEDWVPVHDSIGVTHWLPRHAGTAMTDQDHFD